MVKGLLCEVDQRAPTDLLSAGWDLVDGFDGRRDLKPWKVLQTYVSMILKTYLMFFRSSMATNANQ